jgi:hypothetical protein
LHLDVYPKQVFLHLALVILILLSANIIGIIFRFYFDNNAVQWFIPLFDFNTENNVPTLYSAFTLICSCILLSCIASVRKNQGNPCLYWLGLAIIFLFLSIDEIASIHERLTAPVKELLHVSGLLFYSWVIPYGLLLILFVISYSKFLMSLPRKIMNLFLVSGATFVTGAIGFELLGGRQHDFYGDNNIKYSLLYTCEEFFEMLGIAIFIYTLLLYLSSQFKPFTLSIKK